MFPYLFVFFFTTFITFWAENCFKRKYFAVGVLLSLIAILIPSIVAGCRDSGIGTDTEIYVDYVFEKFRYVHSLKDLWMSFKKGDFDDIELSYLLINYLASLFGTTVNYIYFFTSFFTILFVYIAIYKNRKTGSMWLSIFIFLLLYYNMSFNIVRQNIALAFSLIIFKYLEEKKIKTLLLCLWVILQLHNTAFFYILFVGLYYVINIKSDLKRKTVYISSIIIVAVGIILLDPIINLAVSVGILSSKFLMYLSDDNDQLFMIKFTLSYFLYYCLMYYMYIKIRITKHGISKKILLILNHYLFLRLIGVIMILSSIVSKWAFRISFYFNYTADIIFMPRFFYVLKQKNKKYYNLVLAVYILFLIGYWYRSIVISNDSKTYPYKSRILGF